MSYGESLPEFDRGFSNPQFPWDKTQKLVDQCRAAVRALTDITAQARSQNPNKEYVSQICVRVARLLTRYIDTMGLREVVHGTSDISLKDLYGPFSEALEQVKRHQPAGEDKHSQFVEAQINIIERVLRGEDLTAVLELAEERRQQREQKKKAQDN